MPALSSPTTWRTHPYSHRGYLYVHKPLVVFKARVAAEDFVQPIDQYPVSQIYVDNVSYGYWGLVKPGMTVLVGSTDGAYDLGIQRVKGTSGSVMSDGVVAIGLSSQGSRIGEVNLVDNAYITVLEDFRVWTKTPYYAPTGTILKDYSIGYNLDNAAKYPAPVAYGGAPYAGFADSDGYKNIAFDASESWIVAGVPVTGTANWALRDGTFVSGTATDTAIVARFPEGFRYVSLTITDSNGQSHTHRIPVYVAAKTGEHAPIYDFTVTSHTIEKQGTSMSFSINEDIDKDDYLPGTLILYWEDESYGGTHGSLAGESGREHVKFMGWHDTTAIDLESTEQGLVRDTTFSCIGPLARLKQLPAYDQVVEYTDSDPTSWLEMPNLTIARYIWYLLQWHTNILDVAPLAGRTIPALTAPRIQSSQASVFDQVQEVANFISCEFTCDQRGRLYVKENPMIITYASRTSTFQVELERSDWGSLSINRQDFPRINKIDGYAVLQGTDPENPEIAVCVAPGQAPGQGVVASTFNVFCGGQLTLNEWCGNKYEYDNRKWIDFTLDMVKVGDAGIEPALMEWVQLSIEATDNVQGFSITDGRFLPTTVSIDHDPETGAKSVSLTVELETIGALAKTVITEDYGLPSVGSTAYGTIPESFAGDSYYLFEGIQNIAAIESNGLLNITANFQDAVPIWDQIDLTSAPYSIDGILSCVADPFSPLYKGTGLTVDAWVATETKVYKLIDVFDVNSTRQVVEQFSYQSSIDSVGGWEAALLKASTIKRNWVMLALYYATDYPGDWVTYTINGVTWNYEQQLSSNYSNNLFLPALWLSEKTPGTAYYAIFSSIPGDWQIPLTLKKTTDFGQTWVTATPGVDGPDIVTDNYQRGGCFVFPAINNSDELTAFFGTAIDDGFGNPQYSLQKIVGAVQTDISPSTTILSSCRHNSPGLNISRVNPNKMVLLGTPNFSAWSTFVTEDGGSNWTGISPGIASITQAVFAGDNDDIIYAWGDGGVLTYSINTGTTFSTKLNSGSGATILQLIGG